MLRRLQTLLRRGPLLLTRSPPVGRPPHQVYHFSKKNLPKGFKNFKRDQDKENEKEELTSNKKKEETSEKKEKQAKTEESKKKQELSEGEQEEQESKSEKEKEQEKKKSFTDRAMERFDKFRTERPYITPVLILGGSLLLASLLQPSHGKEVYFNEFQQHVIENKILSVTILKNSAADSFNYVAVADLADGGKEFLVLANIDNFLMKLETTQLEMGRQRSEFIPVKYGNKNDSGNNAFLLIFLMSLGAYIWFSIYRGRGNSIGNAAKKTGSSGSSNSSSSGSRFGGGGFGDFLGIGKTNVQVYGTEKKMKTRFKHVAGMETAKQEVMEFVDFLKFPKKYHNLGAKIPRGALLVGPPGTGKTLLAKAVAGEAGVPFLTISGSDFVEMFVGVGASRVRDLFKKAKEKAPSIIFIDEIDAVGKKRNYKFSAGNDERDSTLNQLLVEMDGFSTDSNVIVLAATNRKDILDSALMRPGRFDRTVDITLPNIKEREEIFRVHLKKIKLDPTKAMSEYARRMASLTPGMSGADIQNTCNEAAIIAARQDKKKVMLIDFEKATERIIGGLEKKVVITPEQRKTVAYHESGHAVAGWFLENSNPLLKLTIVPRSKGSLGFAQYLPDELSLYSKEQLLDMIKVALGGRVSEEIFFKRVTTGAQDDLRKVTQIAYSIVISFGMSERIGLIGYEMGEYGEKPFSPATNQIIDEEVKSIVDSQYVATKELLESKRELIQNLAQELLDKETLTLNHIIGILGERPFPMKESMKEYLEQIQEREAQEMKAEQEQDEEEEQPEDQESEEKPKDQEEQPKKQDKQS